MPALIAAPWLGTAIAGIAGGASLVAGAKIGSNAAKKAGETQAAAADKAIAYEKETTAAALAHLEATRSRSGGPAMYSPGLMSNPFGPSPGLYGQPAQTMGSLSPGLSGGPPRPQGPPQTMASLSQPGPTIGPSAGMSPAGGAVAMRIPDGSIRQIPPQHVAEAQRRGAVRVQ